MGLARTDVSTSSFFPLIQELNDTVERQNNALAQRDERINALTRRLEASENSEFWNMMPPRFKRCYKEIGRYLPQGSTLTYTTQLLTIAGSVYGVAKVVFPDKTVYVCLAIGASPIAFVGLSALIAKVHKVFVQMPSQPNTHPIPLEAPAAPIMGDLRGMNIMPVSSENSEYWNMMPECLKRYWTEVARYLPQESTLRYAKTFSTATGTVVAVVSRVFPDRYVIICIGLGAAYLGREPLLCLASRTYGIFSRVLNQLVAVRSLIENENLSNESVSVPPEGNGVTEITPQRTPDQVDNSVTEITLQSTLAFFGKAAIGVGVTVVVVGAAPVVVSAVTVGGAVTAIGGAATAISGAATAIGGANIVCWLGLGALLNGIRLRSCDNSNHRFIDKN